MSSFCKLDARNLVRHEAKATALTQRTLRTPRPQRKQILRSTRFRNMRFCSGQKMVCMVFCCSCDFATVVSCCFVYRVGSWTLDHLKKRISVAGRTDLRLLFSMSWVEFYSFSCCGQDSRGCSRGSLGVAREKRKLDVWCQDSGRASVSESRWDSPRVAETGIPRTPETGARGWRRLGATHQV
jgi:hypothetical protein